MDKPVLDPDKEVAVLMRLRMAAERREAEAVKRKSLEESLAAEAVRADGLEVRQYGLMGLR